MIVSYLTVFNVADVNVLLVMNVILIVNSMLLWTCFGAHIVLKLTQEDQEREKDQVVMNRNSACKSIYFTCVF